MEKSIRIAKRYIFFLLTAFLPISKAVLEVTFYLFLALWLIENIFIKKRNLRDFFAKTELNTPILAMLIVAFLSIFHSVSPLLSLRGFGGKWLFFIMLYFFTLDIIDSEKTFRRVLWIMLVSFFLVSINGLWQLISGSDFLFGRTLEQGLWIRGYFPSLNTFGGLLILLGPIVIFSTIVISRARLAKFCLLIISIIPFFCLLFSFSVEAWLALGLSFIAASFIWRDKKLFQFTFLFTFLLTVLILIFPVFRERALGFAKVQLYGPLGRVAIWKDTLKEIKKNPVLGKGVNTTTESILRRYSQAEVLKKQHHPHNLYLQIFLEAGILGLGAYLWILWRIFLILFSLRKDNFGFGFFCGFAAFALVNMVDTMWDKRIQGGFWVVVGLIFVYNRLSKSSLGEIKANCNSN